MDLFQKTIIKEGAFSGIGLHTGSPVTVRLKPAAPGTGIRFFKNGKPAEVSDETDPPGPDRTARCSGVGRGPDRILTVEHFASALAGLGIDNILVEVDGPEMPAFDGSASEYVRLLREFGVCVQGEAPVEIFRLREPIFVWQEGGSALGAYPDEGLSFHYLLDYDYPTLRAQPCSYDCDSGRYADQIAPARTFCTQSEARQLKKLGFGAGATAQNTVVVCRDGSHRGGLRFEDECARHKVLDLMGDLALVGFRMRARVVGVRSGHALNRQLASRLRQSKQGR